MRSSFRANVMVEDWFGLVGDANSKMTEVPDTVPVSRPPIVVRFQVPDSVASSCSMRRRIAHETGRFGAQVVPPHSPRTLAELGCVGDTPQPAARIIKTRTTKRIDERPAIERWITVEAKRCGLSPRLEWPTSDCLSNAIRRWLAIGNR